MAPRRIYLDHNATTRPLPEVVAAMTAALADNFGNPSSAHAFGRLAHAALDRAREQFARLIGAKDDEIIFESGGTEADNHVLRSVAESAGQNARIATTRIEHPGVLEPCGYLEKRGVKVDYLPVDQDGLVDPADAERALAQGATLVSVMLANNDVGTIQPLREIARIAHSRGALVHTDAVQALGKIPVDVNELGVDFLSVSSHKVYGPKGIGALYVRHGVKLPPFIQGGSQEGRMRAGTENIPAIVGFGVACEEARKRLAGRTESARGMRDELERGLLAAFPDARVNGHPVKRIPNTLNISFAGLDSEEMLLALDLANIAASAGAACHAGTNKPSHVMLAMGRTYEESRGALRFSFGEENIPEDVPAVLSALTEIITNAKKRKARS